MEVYDLGLRLKALRKNKNLTQEQVADKLELSKSAVSRYERNLLNPSVQMIKKFAVLYESSIDYIMGMDDRQFIILDNLS